MVYYLVMASIVGKRQGNQTYYYLVESARVDGKPRIVSQQYLGSSVEVMAKLAGSSAGEPVRTQHRPHRRHVAEALVLGADRLTRRGTGQLRHHLDRATQVLLRHDPRLAVHPRRLHQVVIRLVALPFPDDRSHN